MDQAKVKVSNISEIHRMHSTSERVSYLLSRHWWIILILFLGLYTGLPFLAPVFMRMNWEIPGRVIYGMYSFLCHQLPQRSFFMFGQKMTYSLTEIQAVWPIPVDFFALRQFIGNSDMGWKVAWSDRMVSMYTSLWFFALLWQPLIRRFRSLPWWGLVLLLLPMAVDGSSHFISDLYGLGLGFRDSNTWLAVLTNNSLPPLFYAGDAWGSFNSLMRLLTGFLFGLGIVWFGFPFIEDIFRQQVNYFESNVLKVNILKNSLYKELK